MSLTSRMFLLLLLLVGFVSDSRAEDVEVLVTGVKSARGQIIVKVYTSSDGYEDDKPVQIIKFDKKHLAGGQIVHKITLKSGSYGLALLDDENGNGVMDYNFVKMPKEGFGFSNFYLSGMKKPKYESFKFTVNSQQQHKVTMKIRYL